MTEYKYDILRDKRTTKLDLQLEQIQRLLHGHRYLLNKTKSWLNIEFKFTIKCMRNLFIAF